MTIRRETIAVTGAAGGAGVATAFAIGEKVVHGRIVAIYLEYLDSPPAGTTDVTIQEAIASPAISILTVSNAATNGWFYPDALTVNSQYAPLYASDHLKVTIAQANNGDGVNATIVWEECY